MLCAQVQERPVVPGQTRRRSVRDGDAVHTIARGQAVLQRHDGRSGGQRGHDVVIRPQQRLMAEGRLEHGGQPGYQPWLAVVVVEHEDTVVGEVPADSLEGFQREEERLEPDVGLVAHQRQRVRQGEHDEVVLLVRAGQEGPSVVHVSSDTFVVKGPVGVSLHPQGQDARVDLDRIDVPGTSRQGQRHIRPAARTHDQHVVVGRLREPLVDLVVEGLPAGRSQGMQALVGDAIDAQSLHSVRVERGADAVVRGVSVEARLHRPQVEIDEVEDTQQGRHARR